MLDPVMRIEGHCPVRWRGRQAIVALPEHIGVSNVSAIRDQLLVLLNRGPSVLTADMTGTMSCDYAGAETLERVHQRAIATGTELRLVITSPVVRRVLTISGLGHLVPVYSTMEEALAAQPPGSVVPLRPRRATARARSSAPGAQAQASRQPAVGHMVATNFGMLQKVADALRDGIALSDEAGILVLVNRRTEEIFGYGHAGLPGLPLDTLIPPGLQAAAGSRARAGDNGLLLTGRRKDGTTIGVHVSFTAVPTSSGRLTLAVIRSA